LERPLWPVARSSVESLTGTGPGAHQGLSARRGLWLALQRRQQERRPPLVHACAYAAVGRRCANCTPAREASRSTPTGGRVCSASPTLPTLNHTSHTPPYPGPSDRRSFGAGLRLLAAFLTLRSPACVLPRSTSVPHYPTKGFPPAVNSGDFLNRIFWVAERHNALSEDALRRQGSASADHASRLRRARS
jgi:hypothetical protein